MHLFMIMHTHKIIHIVKLCVGKLHVHGLYTYLDFDTKLDCSRHICTTHVLYFDEVSIIDYLCRFNIKLNVNGKDKFNSENINSRHQNVLEMYMYKLYWIYIEFQV